SEGGSRRGPRAFAVVGPRRRGSGRARPWGRQALPAAERGQGLVPGLAAHLGLRPEVTADRRPPRLPEDRAAEVVGEVRAADARELPGREAGDRCRDRRRDAARTAAGPADERQDQAAVAVAGAAG